MPQKENNTTHHIEAIAHIHTDFTDKFGIPRQSGLVPELKGKIIFEPDYRIAEAVRGLEGYSHIWLIWGFSKSPQGEWSPTVRPPRLGGNERVGVFASRAPFRPNGLGLSSVRLDRVDLDDPEKPVLWVSGVDMLDQTPIYDIKPYSPFNDIHADATGGFSGAVQKHRLAVVFAPAAEGILSQEAQDTLRKLLSLDPRPGYQKEPQRIYGMDFAGHTVRFQVDQDTLRVLEVIAGIGKNERDVKR